MNCGAAAAATGLGLSLMNAVQEQVAGKLQNLPGSVFKMDDAAQMEPTKYLKRYKVLHRWCAE
jgi:hypothetical protein